MSTTQLRTPEAAEIIRAAKRIQPYIHRTPVLTCQTINQMAGMELFFKCENLQKIGAFKIRGASNAIFSMTGAEAAQGVATHSSGNHAQAVALAARQRGIPAYIVMPDNAPKVKKQAVADYGGKIIFCEPTQQARESTLAKVIADTGAAEVHPFNDYRVICGQATAAKELVEEVPTLDVIMSPVGGGGLLSGTALSVKYFSDAYTIGAEPTAVNDAWLSWQSGQLQPPTGKHTVADGLRTSLGDKTFDIIRQHVREIITAEEADIIAATRLVWERMKILIEPSSAVPLAALMSGKAEHLKGKRIGIIITGGNIDLEALPWA
jgi:threonine dehydratase